MSVVYRIKKIGSRLKYKVKHHRGHGIHSPFVFNFINDVIEEKYAYYAYSDIVSQQKEENVIDLDVKKHQLIFRIVSRFSPNYIFVWQNVSDSLLLYIQAASKNNNLLYLDRSLTNLSDKYDCVFLNLDKEAVKMLSIKDLFSKTDTQSFIIVDNIRTNRATEVFWNELVRNQKVRISLDLFHLGILFFDKKYCKQNYKLSF